MRFADGVRSVGLLCALTVWLVVSNAADAEPPSFLRSVAPVLSKAGCNRGTCHGNANGKGGFKLSLRGQDPDFDYRWLTRESQRRRIDLINPDASLLLLKPTSQVAHEGGTRFVKGSLEYQLLRNWIAAGGPPPSSDEPLVRELRVTPTEAYLPTSESSIQLEVVAIGGDQSRRDVTRLATYEPVNLRATVDAHGRVSRVSDGETTVLVRYLNQQAAVHLAFLPPRDPAAWKPLPQENFVDRFVDAKLRRLQVQPSQRCSDVVFVRRAFLDVLGVLPTADEAESFVTDSREDRRRRLIERLLFRPEFADHWAAKWCNVLRVEEKVLDPTGVDAFHDWIRDAIDDGLPLDAFVRSLIRADGSTYENPPANYWRALRNPEMRGETTARLFLGARLQCAKCHNHPFDSWTQEDYYSWAAVFAGIDYEIVENTRQDRLDKNEFTGEQKVFVDRGGSVVNPQSGRPALPRLLGARKLGPGAYYDRLTPLAAWLTSPANDRFAKSMVNFVWFHLMGRGIVDPIDDLRATNPPTNPPLLDALAQEFVQDGFSLRQLILTVMSSRTYQASAIPNESNLADQSNFSRAIVSRLPAETLLDAQASVIGFPAEFAGFPLGTRAWQIPGVRRVRRRDMSPTAGDRFLKTFGKPERLLSCECERSNETTLAQTLTMIGGELHQRMTRPATRLAALANSAHSDDDVIHELYWAALSRPPDADELHAARQLLSAPGSNLPMSAEQQDWSRRIKYLLAKTPWFSPSEDDRFARIQDLAWALMNSKEFVLRH